MTKCKLCPVGLGLSLGVIWGLTVLITGLVAYHYAYGKAFVTAMGVLYVGYAPSVAGSFIGGAFGFVDAFIGGFLIAWLYNVFTGCKKDGCE